jgi:hypothetical protein
MTTLIIIILAALVLFGLVSLTLMVKQSRTENIEVDKLGEGAIMHHLKTQEYYLRKNV